MFESQSFKEIHVNNGSTGGHDGVNHVVFHQINVNLHTACRGCGTGQGKDNSAIFFSEHPVVNISGVSQIAGGKGHFFHRVDNIHRVDFFNVNVFDFFTQ